MKPQSSYLRSCIEKQYKKEDLIKLAEWKMPFGRFSGMSLIDLPDEYLFWFQKNGFPEGELGELMAFCLELKIEGLDLLIKPLKPKP